MTHATFDRFEFDLERRALLDCGVAVHLSPKAFTLLGVLIDNSPRAVSKKALSDAVWPQTFVEESNLASLVAEVRTALGDDARQPRFVRTVHGFGYAFSAEVQKATPRQRVAVLQIGSEEVPLFEGENILGRDPSAPVQIDHGTVSRRHASITVNRDTAVLEDLSSKNGTFLGVNEERITGPVMLEDGDSFVLGDVRISFKRRTGLGSTVTIGG